jgi:hypothetical protein
MDAPFHDVNRETLVSEKPEGCDAFGLFHFNSFNRALCCHEVKFRERFVFIFG